MKPLVLRHLSTFRFVFGIFMCWGVPGVQAQGRLPDKMLADFESGTYQGWTLRGTWFGQEPANAALFAGKIDGFHGARFLCTLSPRHGVAAQGSAISSEFTIDRPAIRFLIGGGYYPGQTCLNLVVDGAVVRTETGNGLPSLAPAFWNVSDLQGKTAHLEVVDATSDANRGYVMVDDIVLGSLPPRPAPSRSGWAGEDDAGGDGQINSAQEAILGSVSMLKALASLNAARLHSRLPLLALDPALMAAAQSAADAARTGAARPALPPQWQADTLSVAQINSPDAAPACRCLQDISCQTVGLAASGSGWTVVASRDAPGRGAVVALTVAVPGDAPAAPQVPVMPVTGYTLRPLSGVDVSAYHLPVLPGWGTPGTAVAKPAASPPASASGRSVFPVLDGAHWSDSFGAPRVGHTHQGEDLMAPKMRPLVACFAGTVTLKMAASPTSNTAGNTIHLTNSIGWTAIYMHVNCDTPGTLDGKGGARYAFAGGLKNGDHVRAGQFLGYTGDSGNARGGDAHCHFELHPPHAAAVNPTSVLRVARILRSPEAALTLAAVSSAPPLPASSVPAASADTFAPARKQDSLPGTGELQIEGKLSGLAPDGLVMQADTVKIAADPPVLLSPSRLKAVSWSSSVPLPAGMPLGRRVIVVGHDSGPGTLLRARLLVFPL